MSSTAVADSAAAPRDAAGGPAAGAPAPAADGPLRRWWPGDHWSGRLFVLMSVLPGLLGTGWLIAAFPLAALGRFRPVTVVPLAVLVAAVVVPLGLALTSRTGRALRAPWWSLAATVTVAVYFARYAAHTHDEQIILRRDAGSYAQIGYWLAHHPGLTYRVPTGAFGPHAAGLVYSSPAFYHVGDVLVPQFMTGWPTALAAAYWAGGWQDLFLLPALVGGCGILAVGGLTARLVGARWAPLAALATALTWPVLRVTQATFSEPSALLLLATELCLLVDVVAATRPGAGAPAPGTVRRIRALAFAAGLVLGAGELVRLDFGVDAALIIPVVAWLYVTRRPGASAYVLGALGSGALAVADGALVTRPYLHTNAASVRLMMALIAVVAVAAVAAVVIGRRHRRVLVALFGRRWLAPLGCAAVLLAAAALVVRPYVWVDRSVADPNTAEVTGNLQIAQGLRVDGSRGYAEQSLWWVQWYLGRPLLVAGLVGVTLLTWRVLRGREVVWLAPLLVYAGSSVQILVRPGVAPDHPWADRRLVVEVLPGIVLFAVWALAALTRLTRTALGRAAARGPSARAGAGAAGTGQEDSSRPPGGWRAGLAAGLAGVLALGLSAVVLRPVDAVTAPLAPLRTELGEVVASQLVCEALRPTDSVVLIGTLWAPTVRSQCGLPVAEVENPSPATIDRLAASIRAAGRTPVFAAQAVNPLEDLGLRPERAVVLITQQDQNLLATRPFSTQLLRIEFWLVRR